MTVAGEAAESGRCGRITVQAIHKPATTDPQPSAKPQRTHERFDHRCKIRPQRLHVQRLTLQMQNAGHHG